MGDMMYDVSCFVLLGLLKASGLGVFLLIQPFELLPFSNPNPP